MEIDQNEGDTTSFQILALCRREIRSGVLSLNVRIDAVEKASQVFQENLTRVPTEIDKQITALRSLVLATNNAMPQARMRSLQR